MCERWAWPAVLGSVLTIAMGAHCARADDLSSPQAMVVAARDASAWLGAFRSSRHVMRHERVVRRHFHGPRIIGIDEGASAVPFPIPVPQETDEGYPLEPSFGGFGYRPMPPPAVIVAPQIIILPTAKAAVRKIERHEARFAAPIRRRRIVVVRGHPRRLDVMAWRPFVWPLAYIYGPYAVGIVPIGFSPCDDQPHTAIYNTPCGVRPYQ